MKKIFISIFVVIFSCQLIGQPEDVIIPGLFAMPDSKASEKQTSNSPKVKDAAQIDLHRFMGFEEVPVRYLSLPYDTCQHTNIEGSMSDVGCVLLVLLPILFLFSGRDFGLSRLFVNFSIIVLCCLMLAVSIPSSILNKHNLATVAEGKAFLEANPQEGALGKLSDYINKTALGLYHPIQQFAASSSKKADGITYPILIGLFLILIFIFYHRLKAFSKTTQVVLFLLLAYFFLWWVLGAGGAWYGMLIFCLPFIFLIKGMSVPKSEFNSKNLKAFAGKPGFLFLVSGLWLFFAFTYRASNYYPINKERGFHIYIPPFVEYQAGNIKQGQLVNASFRNALQVEKVINQTDGLVYRIGTQMNFFIERNDRRVFEDTFLENFQEIANVLKDKNKIVQALKARGFEYIIFDLNLANNDRTPKKILTRKFTNFMNSLYQNPGVELLLTDRAIKMNDTRQVVNSVFPVNGTITNPGRLAVFRLK